MKRILFFILPLLITACAEILKYFFLAFAGLDPDRIRLHLGMSEIPKMILDGTIQ